MEILNKTLTTEEIAAAFAPPVPTAQRLLMNGKPVKAKTQPGKSATTKKVRVKAKPQHTELIDTDAIYQNSVSQGDSVFGEDEQEVMIHD